MELERFKTMVMPLREKLQNFARSMLTNDIDAEDAVQETYLRLWNARSQLNDHPNPHGFAMQTLKNICIDKIRSSKHQISLDNVNMAESGIDPYTYTEEADSAQIIRKIIDTLPELQRKIMLMRDVEGYELNEIADITGSDIGAVRVNLSRARKKVRDTYISISQIRHKA
ncbi:RNA polymerase sigma-70 factor (ECF subfamily) [Dysgonomonas alginatilytica]|uniref:RNA polymerase sigma-70 factor (ECF subfamily) n=1 Tax=Dysgonomonas alginatilytica TaxID=1605892 RepID=A0A2V3PNQ0_9BACT|nr:RNA polymerase sigma factor [Dysgonomonas alginatilytica]PXV62242.1 RNA polymerase sigma-70 factor (ECF subfamily) [Dysgonomonas alginatilytica]